MSSYNKETKHPKTGKWESAYWSDDYFGKHKYGVQFPSEPDKFYEANKMVFEVREAKLPEVPENVKKLKDIVDVQCSDGNYNYDEYMWGMANGLILAYAIIAGGEPVFLDKPEFINNKK